MSINGWEPLGWIEDGVDTTDGYMFSKPQMREPVVDTRFNLASEFPGRTDFLSAKSVIINEDLPHGMLYVTEHEIVISPVGWNVLIAWLKRQADVRADVSAIVERVMARELAWLRGAGHDV